ncbi:GGDEF domain-containing phosphodiesterase [Desulfosporosinus sp. OT]|uniref:putative bifunctional diguanylate cyclase/phosphodiesterase n=1 Tax=Desulfosporosinus sp. OT TaxID=913865 RepID=UPI000223A305|nr:GGDEF domain-containing phosphodiesterase [Desulfosporosinus sp. OT]EGW38554.1 sensory box protein [Desulfosporosinus sp. OT]
MGYNGNYLSAYAYRKIIVDQEGNPIDYEYIEANEAFKILIRSKTDEDPFDGINFYGNVALTGKAATTEYYSDALERWFRVEVYSPKKEYFVTLCIDITSFKQTEFELIDKNELLGQLYEEVTATEEELRQQMDDLNQAAQLLTESKTRLKRAQKIAHVGNWEFDLETKTVWISEEAFNLYGLIMEKHELSLKLVQQRVHFEDRSRMDEALELLIQGESEYNVNFRIIRADNFEERHMHSIAEVVCNSSGMPVKILGVIQDVTEQMIYERDLKNKNRELMKLHEELRENEQRISHMAYYDYITDLPNRILFLDKLKEAITIAKKNGTNVIVVFLDLDNFKIVNDTLGHTIGDALLIETAKRLLTCIDSKDTAARLSGDEFALLIEDVKPENSIVPNLERIKLIFKEPFWINETMINLTSSIGVSIYPDNGETGEELLNNADTAMYKAKELGKNGYQFFDIKMKENLLKKTTIERLLRKALKNNEFVLHYQPQYVAKTGRIRGFEALIRWNSPEIGFLSPMEFIPIAEESGLIIEIGEWVLNTASSVCKKFQDRFGHELIMAVNISPIQLRQRKFRGTVLKAIKSSGLKPTSLELEVTESIFIDSYDNVANELKNLKDLGVRIALDDFGTGYSSLSYLRKLPISLLKIDKAFVQEIDSLNPYNELTKSIISLVHKLNIETIAEGVETLEQLNYLINAKCDHLQGYYLGKPEPEDLVGDIIEKAAGKSSSYEAVE